ncbi:transient receptor potential cation channel subfamily M member-like 2 isoform X1 [Styela clava]
MTQRENEMSQNRVYPSTSNTSSSIRPLLSRMTGLARNFSTKFDADAVEDSKTTKFIKDFIKKADNTQTDAFGEIEFGGTSTRTAKYVRVADTTNVDILYQLFKKHWKLKTPNLIISVTGGAKNFSLRSRIEEVFRKSLIKAAENTGAWITSGGTHAGVMKHVGKAVKNYAAIRDDKDKVVTIGMAPWGVVFRNDKLINQIASTNLLPKQYDPDEKKQGKRSILDYNHSHFILVDDGSEDKYGVEINLRTELESFLARQRTRDGVEVLIVCVIVQGGPGSLKTVAESIHKKTPVVVVGGSGGWADILATASTMDPRNIGRTVVEELLEEHNMDSDENQIDAWTDMVKRCISSKNLLTVFDYDPNDLSRDLDIAILEALLKANANDDNQAAYQQLRLAMAWNRSDIAKSHILSDDACIGKEEMAKMFFAALKDNKHEFCKVFLDYGVDLKEYCTIAELRHLYTSAPKESLLHKRLSKKKDFSLTAVGRFLIEVLGHSYISVYKRRKPTTKKYNAVLFEHDDISGERRQSTPWPDDARLDDPYREIFQWALLVNYREIAQYIWEYMSESMSAAIIATKILKTLASKRNDLEKKTQMLADADLYEKLAVGVLAKCFEDNVDKTTFLLVKTLPKWGGYTCLHVAIEANDKFFVSRPGVQFFLDAVWMDKLDSPTAIHIVLAGICPPLIWSTISFKEQSEDNNKELDVSENGEMSKTTRTDDVEMQRISPKADDELAPTIAFNNPELSLNATKNSYSILEKTVIFYDAPVVTFWLNVFSFVLYLILFAYIILSDFESSASTISVSVFEYILVGWITTFLFEEIRELADEEARYLKEKIKLHITDTWNIMDLLSLTLFYIGFGLRWFVSLLDEALILYSFSFMIQCVRIVHIFAVHHILGPKIIMVGKMLKDLLFFLFILVVFLLAYGVASQALLYPGETSFSQIIVGIIYKPYWQIYGELFLDEINYNPNVDAFTCSNTNDSLPRCPQQSVIVPIISAIYLLFVNVLLLNLLIAMFSYTFDKVESQGNEIWMFQRYTLITDYYFRPPLVPPFIIFSHFYHLLRFLHRKIFLRIKRDDPFSHALKFELKEDEVKQLRKWEHWHAEAFINEMHEEEKMKVDKQMERLNNRIDNIMSKIEDMQERLTKQKGDGKGLNKLNNTMQSKFRHLEKLIENINAANPSSSHLKSEPKHSAAHVLESATKQAWSEPQTSKPKSPPEPKKDVPVEPVHVKARSSPYPDSTVMRTEVPDDKVLWKQPVWPEYDPVYYTAEIVLSLPLKIWADAELEHYDTKDRPRLPFNKYDQKNKVNRASHTGTYLVVDGIPKNPKGRTGICGRGLLGRYGPNHAADPVVTRWKRNYQKEIIKIDDKPVLEFVAVKRADTGEWAIPGGMVDPGEKVSVTLRREFSEEALNIEGTHDPLEIERIRENVLNLFKSGGLELFKGYCDDHRNTDNAWIETVACNFHDEEGTAFNSIKLNPGEEANKVSWKQVDHRIKLFASHSDILKKAAEMHNAYF